MDPFTSYFALPKVSVKKSFTSPDGAIWIEAESANTSSVCRSCGSLSSKVHDYQHITIREPDHVKKKSSLNSRKSAFYA